MTILDYILPEDRDKYLEIIDRAAAAKAEAKAAKAAAPKAPRKPATPEQKAKRLENSLAKLQAKLAALRAESTSDNEI